MTTAIHPRLVLRAAANGDRYALAQMLSGLSPDSSFQRFFSGSFRVTDKTLDVLLCASGTGRAFVAVEGDRVVGHAMWATTRHDVRRAEIGVVVAAEWRRRGVATRLSRLALADAAKSGIAHAEATALAANHAVDSVVRKLVRDASATTDQGEVTYVAALGVARTNQVHGADSPPAKMDVADRTTPGAQRFRAQSLECDRGLEVLVDRRVRCG